jgi:hypothetical protein
MRLALEGTEPTSFVCNGLFSESYLRRFMSEPEVNRDENRSLYAEIRSLWEAEYHGLRRRKEAYTRNRFLDPVLRGLGWSFIPEESLPSLGRSSQCPDYALFGDEPSRERAACGNSADEVYKFALSILEAKRLEAPLDDPSGKDWRSFPARQVQDYLHSAKDRAGQQFFNWAILSNGNEWRLYSQQAQVDAYWAFFLARGEEFCTFEDFTLFVALFRSSSFELDPDSRCLLDRLRDESLTHQAQVETNLRKRIFDVLEELANGYRLYPRNQITDADLGKLYDSSLIFLYRLLFVLYAESRGLLPVGRWTGANKIYLKNLSLDRLVSRLRNPNEYTDDAFTELYEDILKLFHLINGDDTARNKACGVTCYNGGLFNADLHPFLEKWRVGDKVLANVLKQLMFLQPPARSRDRQHKISILETIDYGTLEVRQLGDIYEGLLGAHLEFKGGVLELKDSRGQNHRHGIFYTPDWIVTYLVNATLRPLLKVIDGRPDVTSAVAESRRDNSFADAVLKLNVLDPAMGSGHFLVRATEFLAESIVSHPTTQLMTERVSATAKSGVQTTKGGRVRIPPGVPQQQAEIAYWRRRIVEACMFGVDINPLAVELAKLSLWLTCIAADEPLNFLDHHLRVGNALLGANPEAIQDLTHRRDERQTSFNVGKRLGAALQKIISEQMQIEEIPSTEMEHVKLKETRWRSVQSRVEPFLWCASLWLSHVRTGRITDLEYRFGLTPFGMPFVT